MGSLSVDKFRYIKIQPKAIDVSTGLWGINPTNSVVIPQSLVMRSIGHVRYINILTWPRGFQVKLLVFFVSKSLLGIEEQRKLEKFTILTRKPRSHARILIYRTWPIVLG